MIRPRRALRPVVLTSLLLASFAVSCAGLLPTRQATPAEQEAYDAALAALPAEPDRAVTSLDAFLAQFPRSPLADDALEKLASIALSQGDTDEAVRRLSSLVARYDGSDRSAAARVNLASIERERGNTELARKLLSRVRFDELQPIEARRGYRLGAEIAPSDVERVRWLAALRGLSDPAAAVVVDAEIDRVLQTLKRDELDRLVRSLGGRAPSARVLLRMAERSLDAGDADGARNALERAQLLEIRELDRGLLETLKTRVAMREKLDERGGSLPTYAELAELPAPRFDGAEGTIGVVLPLSGPFAEYGEESLRGIMLAAGVFGADEGTRVRLVIRDSGGVGTSAAEAVRELAARRDVVAVVGPLLAKEAGPAAEAAERVRVPLVTLTSRESVAEGRRSVLRLRTTARDEVEPLVEHAMGPLGAKRFAILYPADSFGRGMRKHFWDAVLARGGEVVGVASYPPDATDFGDPIRSMIGYSLLTAREQEALRERDEAIRRARRISPDRAAQVRDELMAERGPEGLPLPPLVDFDALFVPDTYDRIGMIAPQLSFHDVRGVQLLGTNGWNHPELLRVARGHVRGAVISALFDEKSELTFVADFVERYAKTFGGTPDVFAAGAYDATNLVLLQLVTSGNTREAILRGLHEVVAYPGASGVITVLPDGNARKRPFLLGVKGRKIVSLD